MILEVVALLMIVDGEIKDTEFKLILTQVNLQWQCV